MICPACNVEVDMNPTRIIIPRIVVSRLGEMVAVFHHGCANAVLLEYINKWRAIEKETNDKEKEEYERKIQDSINRA